MEGDVNVDGRCSCKGPAAGKMIDCHEAQISSGLVLGGTCTYCSIPKAAKKKNTLGNVLRVNRMCSKIKPINLQWLSKMRGNGALVLPLSHLGRALLLSCPSQHHQHVGSETIIPIFHHHACLHQSRPRADELLGSPMFPNPPGDMQSSHQITRPHSPSWEPSIPRYGSQTFDHFSQSTQESHRLQVAMLSVLFSPNFVPRSSPQSTAVAYAAAPRGLY